MRKYILLLSIFSILKTSAQSNPENEFGAWYMYNGTHQISNKFGIKTMAHFRFFEIGDDMQQFISRLGVNYKINKNINVTLGHSYLNTDTSFDLKGGDFNEHRVYEDFNLKHAIVKINLAHRFRAEQRFFNATTGHFIRYQIAFSYPLTQKWSAYLYDEIFFDFDAEAFNQNWLGAGFRYKISNALKIQVGYMKIINDINQGFDRLQLGIILNTDHRKKS